MYTNVISLEEAKDYLGIDDDSRDREIIRMISSALKYIEKRTNIMMVDRDKDYTLINGCVRVYDGPINTLDTALDATVSRVNMNLYSIYTDSDTDATKITLNVGSIDPDNDLLEAAYMLIEHYFEEGERSVVPKAAEDIINMNRRFIL